MFKFLLALFFFSPPEFYFHPLFVFGFCAPFVELLDAKWKRTGDHSPRSSSVSSTLSSSVFLWRKNWFIKNKAQDCVWAVIDWRRVQEKKKTSSHPTNDPIDADAEGALHVHTDITVDTSVNISLPVWSSALYPQSRCAVVRLVLSLYSLFMGTE